VDIKKANSIVNTEAREAIKQLNQSAANEVVEWIKEGNFDGLWANKDNEEIMMGMNLNNAHIEYSKAYIHLMNKIARQLVIGTNDGKLTRNELSVIFTFCNGRLYDSPNKFTSFLRHHGLPLKRIKRDGRCEYGVHVKWNVSKDLRKELEEVVRERQYLKRVK
jgi:hypothetical protein